MPAVFSVFLGANARFDSFELISQLAQWTLLVQRTALARAHRDMPLDLEQDATGAGQTTVASGACAALPLQGTADGPLLSPVHGAQSAPEDHATAGALHLIAQHAFARAPVEHHP